MKTKELLCAFVIFLYLIPVKSENHTETASQKETFGQTAWRDFISPVTTDAKYIFYYGAAATLLLAILEDQISDPTQEEVVDDRPLGDFSRFGDLAGQVYPNIIYTFGMLTHGLITGKQKSYSRSMLMFKSTLYSSALTTFLKYTTREPRPIGNNKDAFPSGHTTTVFAFASIVGAEHSVPYGIAAYTMAGFVGFSRMNDNQHLLHHVIGGAVIGTSYGLSLYYRKENLKKADEKESLSSGMFQLLPTDGFDGAIVMYTVPLSF